MSWIEDFCFVCDKVCEQGSIYCSDQCKLLDHEKARDRLLTPPVSPPLLPVQSSSSESGRRSSAVQVQLEQAPPLNFYVPFYEKGHGSHELYYGRQGPSRFSHTHRSYSAAVPTDAILTTLSTFS
ncbi:hypothetical protein V1512DRAFT_264308 [Lipomyces arxii]|uniref:uncharacterized protein n=1 Tax=Lipomyces arxii TaxID=56418 RepID=UPI0034CEA3E8